MGIGVAVLTETNFVDNWYPKIAAGYTIMSSKVANCAQGSVALAWRGNNLRFKVKLVQFHGSNTLTFQLTTGDEQIYVVGTYIPPNCTRGWRIFAELQRHAWGGCKLLGIDLLDELCLVDLSHGDWLQTPQRIATRVRWMWSHKQGTMQHYLQPD